MILKKYEKRIILAIISISPIIDMIYTINFKYINVDFPIQQIIRGVITFFIIYSIKNKRDIKKLTIISLLLLVGQAYIFFMGYEYNVMLNMGFVLKLINLFAFILYFKEKVGEGYFTIKEIIKACNITAFILSLNIIIANLFSIGLKTYDFNDATSGYKGFIDAHNDVTALLLILLPLIIWYTIEYRNKYTFVNSILAMISLIIIGPKAGKALLILEILILVSIFLWKKYNVQLRKNSIIAVFCIVFATLFIYSNFRIISLELNSFATQKGFRSVISYVVSNRDLQPILIDQGIEGEHLIHPKYQFGMGYYYANKVLKQEKNDFNAVENDSVALIYYTGLFTASIIIFNLYMYLSKIIKYVKASRIKKYIIISLIIGFIHAILGGHVIYSAIANTYLGVIIGLGLGMIKVERGLSYKK